MIVNDGTYQRVVNELTVNQFLKPNCSITFKKKSGRHPAVLSSFGMPVNKTVKPNDLMLRPSLNSKPIFKKKPNKATPKKIYKKPKPLFVTQKRV